jgi:acyl-coenzyme A thioesterase PaaI-like protein
MSITAPPPSSELPRLLDIEWEETGTTRVSGSVAADERHHQPWGIVHGGLYTAVIETLATTGAHLATAIQQGRSQQLWQVDIRRPDDGKLVARGQVRLPNIEA